jgi:putative transposase
MAKISEPAKLDLPKPKVIRNWRNSVKPGRKPTREGEWVDHKARPVHNQHNPVYVTVPVKPDVPDLTSRKIVEAIAFGMDRAANVAWARQKARRRTFRVIHYAVRTDRLEMVVEAMSADSLARGMQGLSSGLARRVNNQIGRKGSLFSDRYDSRELEKPAEVKKVLEYLSQLNPELPVITEPKTKVLQDIVKKRK